MNEPAFPLRLALKRYAQTQALLDGVVTSPRIRFEFHEVEPIHDAFKPMAQRQVYDASEMAIFTYLQAHAYKKPLVLLPVVLAARFQHPCIVYNTEFNSNLTPAMLPGKTIGVRAYSQTTGAWVRNILADEYGLDLKSIKWITFEGGHLEEYVEPAFVTRAASGTKLLPMLMSGGVDAAILGNDLPDDPRIRAVIPDASQAGKRWHDKTGLVPINHMLVVTRALADARPDIVRELFHLFCKSKSVTGSSSPGQDLRPIGCAATKPSLQLAIDLAYAQQLIPVKPDVDALFADARKIIGDECE